MNKLFKGFLAAALLSTAAPLASASVIDFEFTSNGFGYTSDSCGFFCFEITTLGVAQETGGIPGANSWDFEGVMQFVGSSGGGIGVGLDGWNGGWQFQDRFGSDNLWGSFAMAMSNGSGLVTYAIEGGSGLFTGAFGSGRSYFEVTDGYFPYLFTYHEEGSMRAAVSEPGSLALFGACLLGLAFVTRRRLMVRGR